MSDSEPAINRPTDVISAKQELNALLWEFAEQHHDLQPKIAHAFALVEQLSPCPQFIPETLGLLIGHARDRLALIQKEFSEILGVTRTEIAKAETQNRITRKLRRALQRLLGTDLLENISVDTLVTVVRAKMEQK